MLYLKRNKPTFLQMEQTLTKVFTINRARFYTKYCILLNKIIMNKLRIASVVL